VEAKFSMSNARKTAIVTGASRGIGAAIVSAFLERDFNVVATSRAMTRSTEVMASERVALVDGDIGRAATAARVVDTARSRFGSLDALVNNAGILRVKPFTAYSPEEIRSLLATNVEGFVYVTQLAVQQMRKQGTGGSIVTITAALASTPIRGIEASISMLTKGGLETITRQLAMEYARDNIRVNAVSPGAVDTLLHAGTPKEALAGRSPMGRAQRTRDVSDAVMYLTDAAMVTGDVLFVDGGAHLGRW
jgi:NAD(P)-dependent dehydrogenase (short-subunit alcohol dehydrogenase family)